MRANFWNQLICCGAFRREIIPFFFVFFCFPFLCTRMNEQKHGRFRVIKASGSALELCNLFHHHGSIVTLIGYEFGVN